MPTRVSTGAARRSSTECLCGSRVVDGGGEPLGVVGPRTRRGDVDTREVEGGVAERFQLAVRHGLPCEYRDRVAYLVEGGAERVQARERARQLADVRAPPFAACGSVGLVGAGGNPQYEESAAVLSRLMSVMRSPES